MRASAWLLAAAGAVGAGVAVWRFGFDRPPPALLGKAHGWLASAGLTLLSFGWVVAGLPRLASTALGLLWLAALGGILTAQARRWTRAPPPPELLAFGHMAVAATGFVLLLAAALSGRP